ncbi:MAG: response regulator transcription factor [Flavisolibacter sp.]
MERIRVVLAEDNEVYFSGLKTILEETGDLALCGAVRDGAALMELLAVVPVDVVVTDIQMPRLTGIAATKLISKAYPGVKVIALTMYNAEQLIIEMLEAGARGYLDKNTRIEHLIEAVRAVHAGAYYHCPSTTMRLSKMIAGSKVKLVRQAVVFTETELAMIRLICEEYANKEIAAKLFLSESRVDKYKKRIQEKMDVRSTAGIVVYAMQNGLYEG